MTLYARSDTNLISVGGGCGQTHERPKIRSLGKGTDVYDRQPWALTCPICEAILAGDADWVSHPDRIRLTPDEEFEAEAAEKAGNTMVKQMTHAMAEAAANAVRLPGV